MKVNVKGCLKLFGMVLLVAVMFLLVLSVKPGLVKAATKPNIPQVRNVKQVEATTSGVKLSWDNVVSDNTAKYEVEVSLDGINWLVKNRSSYNSLTHLNGLNDGTTYYIRVRASVTLREDNVGTTTYYGAYSTPVEVVTAPSARPTQVKKTSSTGNSINVTWDPVLGANLYYVDYGTNSENLMRTQTSNTSITLSDLAPNTKYMVRVYPCRRTSNGNFITKSDFSTSAMGTGFGVTPTKVQNVVCEFYWQTSGKINIKYDAIPNAAGYQAQVWTYGQGKEKKVQTAYGDAFGTTLSKSAYKKHRMYKVKVRAYTTNFDGNKSYGAWSAWRYIAPQPDIKKMERGKNKITLTWDKIDGAKRYTVYASTKKNKGYKKVTSTTKTKFDVKKVCGKKLKKNKKYYFYVTAQARSGGKYVDTTAANSTYRWKIKFK